VFSQNWLSKFLAREFLSCLVLYVEKKFWISTKIMVYSLWNTHTHPHPFNGPLSGTTRVSRYQKGKTNLDFTEARDSEWQ